MWSSTVNTNSPPYPNDLSFLSSSSLHQNACLCVYMKYYQSFVWTGQAEMVNIMAIWTSFSWRGTGNILFRFIWNLQRLCNVELIWPLCWPSQPVHDRINLCCFWSPWPYPVQIDRQYYATPLESTVWPTVDARKCVASYPGSLIMWGRKSERG